MSEPHDISTDDYNGYSEDDELAEAVAEAWLFGCGDDD